VAAPPCTPLLLLPALPPAIVRTLNRQPPTANRQPQGVVFQHAVMNLPALAIEFLDAFNGAFDPGAYAGRLPLVHLYTFKRSTESDQGRALAPKPPKPQNPESLNPKTHKP
jgi:hypothetical protein